MLESLAGLEQPWIWGGLMVFCILLAIEWEKLPWFRKRAQTQPDAPISDSVDYIGAMGIIDQYLGAALAGERGMASLAIKQDFIERFGKVTGAKLGEYEYNRALLHQWMQANAARLLIENRHGLV